MRQDIEFQAEGPRLRGWLYTPDAGTGPFPTIVLSPGFSAVKEMYVDRVAEVFAEAGLAALVFDNRKLGASEGEPRQEIDPWVQVRDYRHAITYARTRPEVDRDGIGVWGHSYSGAHVLVVGALDRRVQCVVSQVPLISGWRTFLRRVHADLVVPLRTMFDQDREARLAGQPPAMVPVVNADPFGPAVLPGADAYQWYTESARTRAPTWRNEVTLRSVEMYTEYEPGIYIERISPTPLLMVVAGLDHQNVTDEALMAYNRALEPKKLMLLPGGHFEAYDGPGFEQASEAAIDWFVKHLAAGWVPGADGTVRPRERSTPRS